MCNEIIRLRDISCTDLNGSDLRGLDFYLNEGESVGVVGEFFSGKSALLSLLEGKLSDYNGYVFFQGKLLRQEELHEKISVHTMRITGESDLFESLTIGENILLICSRVKHKCFSTQELYNRAEIILGEMKVSFTMSDRIQDISYSEKYAVLFTIALCTETRIILIDYKYQELSYAEFSKMVFWVQLMKEKGISLIFTGLETTHINLICNRIVFLYKGIACGYVSGVQLTEFSEDSYKKFAYPVADYYLKPLDDNKKPGKIVFRGAELECVKDYSWIPELKAFEYSAIVDPDEECSNRLFEEISREKTKVAAIDVNLFDRQIESLSPMENICLRLAGHASRNGILQPHTVKYLKKKFCEWSGELLLAEKRESSFLSKEECLKIALFQLKIRKPKAVFVKGFLKNTDEKTRTMILDVLSDLRKSGSAVCMIVTKEQIVDFADNYILFCKHKVYPGISYNEMCRIRSDCK